MSLVYHYTDTNGFMGILNSNKDKISFWFTRFDCLNDITEGKELPRILKIVVQELYDNNEITLEEFECLNKLEIDNKIFYARTRFDEENLPITRIAQEKSYDFILSFCKKPDILEMWRYYSKNEQGYCLGFEKSALEFITKVDPFTVNNSSMVKFSWCDVIYDDVEKRKLVKSTILSAKNDAYKIHKQYDELYYKSLSSLLRMNLKEYQYTFKHECFSNEQEIRAIISIPKKENLFDWVKDAEVKFRNSNGMIVPYLEYDFFKGCLNTVMVSPLSNDNVVRTTQDYVNAFMKSDNHKVMVEKSELPIRF